MEHRPFKVNGFTHYLILNDYIPRASESVFKLRRHKAELAAFWKAQGDILGSMVR